MSTDNAHYGDFEALTRQAMRRDADGDDRSSPLSFESPMTVSHAVYEGLRAPLSAANVTRSEIVSEASRAATKVVEDRADAALHNQSEGVLEFLPSRVLEEENDYISVVPGREADALTLQETGRLPSEKDGQDIAAEIMGSEAISAIVVEARERQSMVNDAATAATLASLGVSHSPIQDAVNRTEAKPAVQHGQSRGGALDVRGI